MAKIFFLGGVGWKSTPTLFDRCVYENVYWWQRGERLLGLQVISVWTYGSGLLYFGQLCSSHGVLQMKGELQ